jgi:hypothetical protein
MAGATKAAGLFLAACLLSLTASAEPGFLSHYDDDSVLGLKIAGTVQPGYRMVEGISDGVYGFLRSHVINNLFPARMTRSLRPAPRGDSGALFSRKLNERQERFTRRARQDYPVVGKQAGPAAAARMAQWRSQAIEGQLYVALDAIQDTLLERYQLEVFGQAAGNYASDRRNWDPGFLTMAGIFGGAFVYMNGVDASAKLGDVKVDIDLAPAQRLYSAMRHGSASRLGTFEIGYKDAPLTVSVDWGMESRRLRGEQIGLNYRLAF